LFESFHCEPPKPGWSLEESGRGHRWSVSGVSLFDRHFRTSYVSRPLTLIESEKLFRDAIDHAIGSAQAAHVDVMRWRQDF
jgi:hypothetical protein